MACILITRPPYAIGSIYLCKDKDKAIPGLPATFVMQMFAKELGEFVTVGTVSIKKRLIGVPQYDLKTPQSLRQRHTECFF